MSVEISQLIDKYTDEETRDSVFDSIYSNEPNSKTWARYHLIGNMMRGEVSATGCDLSRSIAESISNEPTVLAPRAIKTDGNLDKDLWKPVSMLALAASIALMAVFVLNPVDNKNNKGASNLVAINGSNSISQKQKFANEFDEMLVGHGEFTASSGLNGLVAYAKLVSNQHLEQ